MPGSFAQEFLRQLRTGGDRHHHVEHEQVGPSELGEALARFDRISRARHLVALAP